MQKSVKSIAALWKKAEASPENEASENFFQKVLDK